MTVLWHDVLWAGLCLYLLLAAAAMVAVLGARPRPHHKPPVPDGGTASPAQRPAPGHNIPTILGRTLACTACRARPTGHCTCPVDCGHRLCTAFTDRDLRWMRRHEIGEHHQ